MPPQTSDSRAQLTFYEPPSLRFKLIEYRHCPGLQSIIMARDRKELFHEAAQLPPSDRATLVGLLIESLEPTPESDVEAEIARRATELDAGTVETIPWEEVRAELFGRRNEGQIPSGGLQRSSPQNHTGTKPS